MITARNSKERNKEVSMADFQKPTFIDATDDFDRFRIALRHVWNSYIWSDRELRDWDMVDNFREIKLLMIERLLKEKLRRRLDVDQSIPLNIFVVPSAHSNVGPGHVAIRISETLNTQTSRDWNQPPDQISSRDMRLAFIDFFDWSWLSIWDLRYFLVEVAASDRYSGLVGRQALIEVNVTRVLVFSGTVTDEIFAAALGELMFIDP